jgi:hypothetical protein
MSSVRLPRSAATWLALALGGCALAPAAALAWERPTVLSPPTDWVVGPSLAVDRRGDALLAWSRGIASTEEFGLPPAARVEASLRPSGAPGWAVAQPLSPSGELALDPHPLLLPSGAAIVTWTTVRRGIVDVTASEGVNPGHGWTLAPLDMETGVWVERRVATGADGTLAIAELDPWSERPALRVRTRASDGAWSESTPPSLPTREAPEISLAPDGTVLLAALEERGASPNREGRARLVSAAWDPAVQAWGARQQMLFLRGGAGSLRIVAGPDGTTTAAWTLRRRGGFAVVAASRPPGGTFGTPRILGQGSPAPDLQLAASTGGTVFVGWYGRRGPRIRVLRPGGDWSAPEEPPPGVCVEPQSLAALAAGPSGEALVVALAGYANDWHPGLVRAWVRRAGGSWAGPVWLSRAFAGSPVAAIDGAGRMHVAWSRESARPARVEATSSTLAEAEVAGIPQDAVPTVSGVRVVARGRARVVRFRLTQAGGVLISLRPRRRAGVEPRELRVLGRRGANAVALGVRGPGRVPPGRWTASVRFARGFIAGCPVTSAPFTIG